MGSCLTQAGYFWLYAVLMSIVIYSGATQFLAIGLFANHAALIEIAVTTLLLNIRHSFFGLSLIRKFSGISSVKPYLIFALTDETYALLTAMDEPSQRSKARYYFFISLLNHLYWITGTFMGALLGQTLKTDLKGMEFALTALFVVLAIEQYRKVQSLKTFYHWSCCWDSVPCFCGFSVCAACIHPVRHNHASLAQDKRIDVPYKLTRFHFSYGHHHSPYPYFTFPVLSEKDTHPECRTTWSATFHHS